MKKIIFAAAAALMMLIGTKANAQLYFGGSVAFSTSSFDDGQNTANSKTSGTSFKFMPEVGFRINDRMAVGGTIGYMHGIAALGSLDPNDYKGLLLAAAGVSGDRLSANNSVGVNVGGRKIDGVRFAPYFRFSIVNSRRFNRLTSYHLKKMGVQTQINADNSKSTTTVSRIGLDVDSANIMLGFIFSL